jgi:AraC family transcriptional regulator, arabinose operon regulatory protein
MGTKVAFYRHLHAKSDRLMHRSTLRSDALTVDGLGIREGMSAGVIDRSLGTDGYLLMLFCSPVTLLDESSSTLRASDSIIFWHPGQRHYYGEHHRRWLHSWIHFSGPGLDAMVRKVPIPSNRALPFLKPKVFEANLEEVYEEMERAEGSDASIVENLVENLLIRVYRLLTSADEKRLPPAHLVRVKRYIEDNSARSFSLAELGQIARLSVPHLCSEFTAYFGRSPIQYRAWLRLHQAQFFLRDRSLRISEIAARVGYSDPAYFSRHFFNRFGVSPLEARRRFMGKLSDPAPFCDMPNIAEVGAFRLGEG